MGLSCWLRKLIKPNQTSLVLNLPFQENLPTPEFYQIFQKRLLLYNFIWHSSSDNIYNIDEHGQSTSFPGLETSEDDGQEMFSFINCHAIYVQEQDYHPEYYDATECAFLTEVLGLLENINTDITELYREYEHFLNRMMFDKSLDPEYSDWGSSKILVELTESIYPIISPVIICKRVLEEKLKTNPSYEKLIIRASVPPSPFAVVPLIRSDSLKHLCESYLSQIQEDLSELLALIKCIGVIDEPDTFYTEDFPDPESAAMFGSRELISSRISKLLPWSTFHDQVLHFYREEKSKSIEIKKLQDKTENLVVVARKKFRQNPQQLHQRLTDLKCNYLLRESKVEDKYWSRKVKYDREVAWNLFISNEKSAIQASWKTSLRLIDMEHRKGFHCRKTVLKAKKNWEKGIDADLLREVQLEIEMEIGDGDPDLCMKPMDAGPGIKMEHFMQNDVSQIQTHFQGRATQKQSSLDIFKNGMNLSGDYTTLKQIEFSYG